MIYVILFLLLAASVYFLWHEALIKTAFEFLFCVVALAFLFELRLWFLPYATLDYVDFLAKWVDFYRRMGGFAALKFSNGNYNVPYLYFLALFSYIRIYDLYLIKLLSIIFDVVMAFAGLKLVSIFTENRYKLLACFFIILLLPTVILNGACWSQCDSIYAAFALWSLYCLFRDRPVLSMVLLALSFGFKLQAIFIMPVCLAFLISGKLKFRHLFVFPLTYVILVLPALLEGRPFLDTITLYFNQIGSVGEGLNYNSPSVYAFLSVSKSDLAGKLGIAAAFLFILIFCIVLFLRRRSITNEVLLTLSLLISIAVPFFLPHMHDRYFFIADVLSVCYTCVYKKRFFLPVLVSFASLLGYYAYLQKRYLLTMNFGAVALIIVMACLIYSLYALLKEAPGKNQADR